MWSNLITATLVLAALQVEAQNPPPPPALPPCKEADTVTNLNSMIQIISFCDNSTDLDYLHATAEKLTSCSVQVSPPVMFKFMEFISKLDINGMSCISTDEISKSLKGLLCKFVGNFIDQNAGNIINNIKSAVSGVLNGIKGALPNIRNVLTFFMAPPMDAPNVKYSPNPTAAPAGMIAPMPAPVAAPVALPVPVPVPAPEIKSAPIAPPAPPPPPPTPAPPPPTPAPTPKPAPKAAPGPPPFNPFGWLGNLGR